MIRCEKAALLLTIAALLLAVAPAAEAAQPQPQPQQNQHLQQASQQPVQANLKLPAKISFDISPNPSYFWSAGLTENAGNLSWAGLPKTIEIHVSLGGPIYKVYSYTSLPFAINTGDLKFLAGSEQIAAVKVISENGYVVASKMFVFPVTNSVFNITMLGPAQPLLYKPVFNP